MGLFSIVSIVSYILSPSMRFQQGEGPWLWNLREPSFEALNTARWGHSLGAGKRKQKTVIFSIEKHLPWTPRQWDRGQTRRNDDGASTRTPQILVCPPLPPACPPVSKLTEARLCWEGIYDMYTVTGKLFNVEQESALNILYALPLRLLQP